MIHHQTSKICNQISKKAQTLLSLMIMGKGKMSNLFARTKMMSFKMVMRHRASTQMMKRLMIMNSLKLKNHIQVMQKKKLIYKLISALNQLILIKKSKNWKNHRVPKLKIKKQQDNKKYKHILVLSFMEIECILLAAQAFKKYQSSYLELSLQNQNIIQNKN